jgi:hypothetical protein
MRLRTIVTSCLFGLLSAGALQACFDGGELAEHTGEVEAQPAALTDAELAARREKIRGYFSERQARLKVQATTFTKSGQIIDWIPRGSQSPDGKISEPPRELGVAKAERDQPRLDEGKVPRLLEREARTELQLDASLRGPKGTVPVVRFDIEQYLKLEKNLPENPEDVFAKEPPPAPASNSRYYGVWQRFATMYGSAGRVNIWDVSGLVSGETSIAQVAVIRGSPMQAIEAGKIETTSRNSGRPRFFTYYRTNGGAVATTRQSTGGSSTAGRSHQACRSSVGRARAAATNTRSMWK